MWFGTIVLCFILQSFANSINQHEFSNKFVCNKKKCVQANLFPNLPVMYNSLELCRLTCGEFSNLWPIPSISANLGDHTVEINKENVSITSNVPDAVKSYIDKVSKIFLEKLWDGCSCNSEPENLPTKVRIHINVSQVDLELLSSTDESYKLDIYEGDFIDVQINAATIFGARHGFETLTQLTARTKLGNNCSTHIITNATIRDNPIFKHRGLLIDTSRNFLTVEAIKRTLRGMASVKLNVLHWHATDSHSFPLSFKKISSLAKYGAYSTSETYKESDMKHIIEYGRLRGVRVILEIDSPGHAGNGWQFQNETNLGRLALCINKQPWTSYCQQPPCGQMNPVNPNLYIVLNRLYREIGKIFQQEYFHMGGDEVLFSCWEEDDEIKSYMKDHGIPLNKNGYKKLWTDFHGKALEAWDNAVGHKDTKIILWTNDLTKPNEILDRLSPKRFVIETWLDDSDSLAKDLINKGYSIIYATENKWYLDHGFQKNSNYLDWKYMYSYKIPIHEKVLGGEISMWGEMASSSNLDQKIWPRAAAVAERLWSSPSFNTNDVTKRKITQIRNSS